MAGPAYRQRTPKASPLWQCLFRHFEAFLGQYEECHQKRYGFLRPVITDVVNKFIDCGDLEHGFARIRCDQCKKDHLLAFSCKGRWFCPSCHQKKVQLFGVLLAESILYPVPHRHYTLGIPKMLRPYFRYNRDLLKQLCRIARDCLIDYQREILQLPDGISGAVLAIHTFGEYLGFHPHLHALVADGLFHRGGWFHVLPESGIHPLEELFRARTIAFLVKEGLLSPDRARMLLGWRHSGFCVHRSKRVQPHQKEDLERLAQYIIRNPFSVEKMYPDPETGTIIYRSGMNPNIRRNFEIFTPCDFIAAITQHIPDKNFQLVRYYGWYSNKMRGQRNKQAESGEGEPPGNGIEIIDVSEHRPRRPPSPKWRELIKKVWEADPLICPTCSREMRIVALIDQREVIERILRHLGLWTEGVRLNPARAPPDGESVLELFPGDPFPDYSREPVMDYDLCADA
jgi:hypothetical protein